MSEIRTRDPQVTDDELELPQHAPQANVLLVDDQPARLLSYEAILSGMGVNCVRALSGAAALAALLEQYPRKSHRCIRERVGRAGIEGGGLATQVLESGQSVRYEDRVRGRDFLITMFVLDDTCVASSAVDVTDRIQAEAALRENELRSRALWQNAPVAVAHNSPDGRFQYVNRGFCELVGYSAD